MKIVIGADCAVPTFAVFVAIADDGLKLAGIGLYRGIAFQLTISDVREILFITKVGQDAVIDKSFQERIVVGAPIDAEIMDGINAQRGHNWRVVPGAAMNANGVISSEARNKLRWLGITAPPKVGSK